MRADCVTLWIGDSLGPVERACLRSVMGQRHTLALYCYREPNGVPDGVEVRDASDILPEAAILRHERGSVALFSDWFRYELQRRALGTWVDTDNYLLAPLDMERPYLLRKADRRSASVLAPTPARIDCRRRTPIAARTLPCCLPCSGSSSGPKFPTGSRGTPKSGPISTSCLAEEFDLSRLPWGTAGPFAVTALAERYGLSSEALPIDVFNPVPWYQARWIANPEIRLEDMVTDRTVGIHLWNECIKDFKDHPASTGSFLERLQREGA